MGSIHAKQVIFLFQEGNLTCFNYVTVVSELLFLFNFMYDLAISMLYIISVESFHLFLVEKIIVASIFS